VQLDLLQQLQEWQQRRGLKEQQESAGFLGGKYGKLLAGAGLEVAATVGTTMAVSKGIENFGGVRTKAQGLAGGGYVSQDFLHLVVVDLILRVCLVEWGICLVDL
jgi:hypothetical protein